MLAANLVLAPQVVPTTVPLLEPIAEVAQAETVIPSLAATLPVCEGKKLESRTCIGALVTLYAKKYGVSKKLALDIAECESSLRGNVFGDGGRAYGTFQFHKPTFKAFSKQLGEELDYYNNEHNIKLAMWAIARGNEAHWSCYDKVTN